MKREREEKFREYYEKWVYQLQLFLPQLIAASRGSHPDHLQLHDLVSKLTAHHKDYYTHKWGAAHHDVLPFYSPSWWTPLENAYSWFTGWKPSTVFRLVASVRELSEEQLKKIEQLRVKIKYEEAKIEREMERQQVGLADRKVLDLARFANTIDDDDDDDDGRRQMEATVRSIGGGLEKMMKAADCVRLKTLKGLLDVMSPLQCVDFLAAFSILNIQLHSNHHPLTTNTQLILAFI